MISHQSREDNNPRFGHLLMEHMSQSNQQQSLQEQGNKDKFSSNGQQYSNKESIVREAAQGKIDAVKEILQQYPTYVDNISSGKTALQVAAHQGHFDIVSLLIDANADVNLKDDEGDTALHYAGFGNQPEIIELLLKKGADIDATNRTKCSSLHIAVNKGYHNCARVLIKYNCNVNLQDSYGDTALHDAIGRTENYEIIDALISSPFINFGLRNKRGFNILHHAALKGNTYAAEKIIAKSRQLVDCKKEDGFAALHLAALNGHSQMIETLVIQGQADINISNNRKQTPLHLAVGQLHFSIIEFLISYNANVNQFNEDNDTPLHIAMSKCNELIKNDRIISPGINNYLSQLSKIGCGQNANLAIACYLIKEGNADVNLKNRKGKTPIDLLDHLKDIDTVSDNFNQLKTFILQLIESRNSRPQHAIGAASTNDNDETIIVNQSSSENTLHTKETPQTHTDHMNEQSQQHQSQQSQQQQLECIICNDILANVLFEPCKHIICCSECCARMKKCIKCNEIITSKIIKGEKKLIIDNSNNLKEQSSSSVELLGNNKKSITVDRLLYLESKIAEIEEANSCTICMERVRNVVFLCGHGACANCAQTLKICHMCRKTITKKINLY